MPWTLPTFPAKTYSRNPLEAVVVQLRFDPILRVREHVVDFQDGIRHRFPKYEEQVTQSFEITPFRGVRVRENLEFRFRTSDKAGTALLSTEAVAVETRAHIERGALLEDFGVVMHALRSAYSPINPLRLGLRYVNVLDREQISADLGEELGWHDLVAGDFIRIPCGLANLDGMAFGSELSGDLDDGRLTLRYAMVSEKDSAPRFRIDLDRSVEGNVDLDRIQDTLMGFAGDIYSVFMSAAGDKLVRWMDEG
ncbi:MAG: TIGR04255 family protein [Myxococcota bacterium]